MVAGGAAGIELDVPVRRRAERNTNSEKNVCRSEHRATTQMPKTNREGERQCFTCQVSQALVISFSGKHERVRNPGVDTLCSFIFHFAIAQSRVHRKPHHHRARSEITTQRISPKKKNTKHSTGTGTITSLSKTTGVMCHVPLYEQQIVTIRHTHRVIKYQCQNPNFLPLPQKTYVKEY